MLRTPFLILSAFLLAASAAGAEEASQPDPRQLLEDAQDKGTPETMQQTMTMTLIDSGGREQARELELRKVGDEKQLVWFVKPAELRGTAFLRLGNAQNKRMWLYLPAFKKLERISGAKENESFLGSDFTYADMGERDLDLYNHEYAGQTEIEGTKVHKVSSTLKEEDDDALYGKIVSYVGVDGGRLIGEDLYDTMGDLYKRKRHKEFQKVEEYTVPTVILMTDVQAEHSTRLSSQQIKVDQRIPDRIFSTQYLKRIRP